MAILKKTKKTESAPKAEATGAAPKSAFTGPAVLVRAIVSEKSTMNEAHGVYTFEVTKEATKIDVKNAVRAQYGVQPTGVRMLNVDGKNVRFGRYMGRRNHWKKAVVTLTKGTTIDIHEGV